MSPRRYATLLACLLLPIGAGSVTSASATPPAARHGAARHARWSGSVHVGSRAAVNAAYWREYASGLGVPIGYAGSGCGPGRVSARSRAATLRALDFVRSLAGLAPVGFSTTLDRRAQRTAVMMSANRRLSHTPRRGWRCWTPAGAANARRSNLALAYPRISPVGAIRMYLDDRGGHNRAAAHRRWLLNPFSTTMGSGATRNANAITVIGPSTRARPSPAWVSWPSRGWFPNRLEPHGRWSLSAGTRSISFTHARVVVRKGGKRIHVRRFRPARGYAMPTLVWQMPRRLDRTATYRVTVRRIHRAGTRHAFKHTWRVRLFTPRR